MKLFIILRKMEIISKCVFKQGFINIDFAFNFRELE